MQLSSLPISGYFCIISAPTVTPAWLWKSQAASVIATCYARASTIANKNLNKGRTSAVLIDICPLVNSQWKQGIPHSLLYIIPSLPHPVSAVYFRNRYRGKMLFLILVHDLHFMPLNKRNQTKQIQHNIIYPQDYNYILHIIIIFILLLNLKFLNL